MNFTAKLPNNSLLVGFVFNIQLMTREAKSTKALKVVTTNLHSFKVQR